MTQTINDKKISIHFSDSGQGTPVVLLHGFMENLMVWDDFAKELAASTRVIAIDLPGHGKTECFGETCTMDQMAKVVKAVLDHLSIEKCYLIGHSMGGYVTLAFAENHPERLWGFSLFHSVATPDTEEKKKARQQTINKINEDKKDEVILSHVPKTFATDNLDTFRKKIIKVTQDSLKTNSEGIIAALKGMMERPDRTHLLKNTSLPILFFIGKKDNFIPSEKALEQASLSDKIQVVELENSGHMGHIEEKEKSLKAVLNFIKGNE